ncbi:MAG: LysR family transcriptional regulator [Verrucomicrobia bacterium]|nr:LysR family transcriptional regulator [Verrucomicrobiota bacterium]MBV8641397.1 LysR family transcriptional regulator [Verrucomicrobiota bacterium]
MINEHLAVGTDGASISRRFGLAAQGYQKRPPKSDTKVYQNHPKPWSETMHIRMMDLSLFRVFDAMMLHRSVRKASQLLSITPSAVSHALRRLRQSIGDDLFIPGESGMQPTRRALDLASAVREGLEKIELALRGQVSEPAGAFRTFRIAACDYACMLILPSLVKRLAKSAPHVDLRVFASNSPDVDRQLEKGQADLVIGWFNQLPESIRRATLLREDEVMVMRAGHPLTHSGVTKERLLEFPHLVVVPLGAEENEANGSTTDEGVAHRIWTERVLHEFQQGKINLAGHATVCVPNFAAMAPFSPIDRHGCNAAAPASALDRCARSRRVAGFALYVDDSGHRDAMGPKHGPGSRPPVVDTRIGVCGGCRIRIISSQAAWKRSLNEMGTGQLA